MSVPLCNRCRLAMVRAHGVVPLWRCPSCNREIPQEGDQR